MTDQALLSAGYDLAARWTGAATDPRGLSAYRGSSSLYGADLFAQPPGDYFTLRTLADRRARADRSVAARERARDAKVAAQLAGMYRALPARPVPPRPRHPDRLRAWREANPDKVAADLAKRKVTRQAASVARAARIRHMLDSGVGM